MSGKTRTSFSAVHLLTSNQYIFLFPPPLEDYCTTALTVPLYQCVLRPVPFSRCLLLSFFIKSIFATLRVLCLIQSLCNKLFRAISRITCLYSDQPLQQWYGSNSKNVLFPSLTLPKSKLWVSLQDIFCVVSVGLRFGFNERVLNQSYKDPRL